MPNRPRPRSVPKAFDVFKPGKTQSSPTSRPVIVGRQPQVQDHTVVEKHGVPVSNAHPVVVTTAKPTKPVLGSLAPRQSAHAPSSAEAHHAMHRQSLVPHIPAPETVEESVSKKVSHTGSTIAPPSTSAAHRLHPTSISVKQEKGSVKPAEQESEEPNLAAVPITPVEQPSSLLSAKTEGKEELLAAMPIEIRRSIASAEGMQEADWNMPGVTSAPAATPPVSQQTETQTEPVAAAEQSITTLPAQASQPAAAPPATAQAAPAAHQAAQIATPGSALKPEKRHSDAIVFIIMFVLFLALAGVVVILFASGSISI